MGYTETEQKAFDEVVVEFWDWFQNKKDEQVYVRPKDRGGKVPVPKYTSEAEILALYYREGSGGPADPIAAAMTDDDIRDLMDELMFGEETTDHDGAGTS